MGKSTALGLYPKRLLRSVVSKEEDRYCMECRHLDDIFPENFLNEYGAVLYILATLATL